MKPTVIVNIAAACEKMGEIQLGGIKLETADAALLDVSQFDLDTHVAAQPSAIAYYGSLKKEASRRLAALKRAYDRWQKKVYATAKASLGAGTGKVNIGDIEARMVVDNEPQIEKWEADIEKAQFEFDTLDSWFEAWRQKSFSIREFASVDNEERYAGGPHMGGEEPVDQGKLVGGVNTARVKSIIRKRMSQEGQG